jgi:hypothetical protein
METAMNTGPKDITAIFRKRNWRGWISSAPNFSRLRIRQKLYEKQAALRNELAKENPDTARASKLQGEISRLQAELDQKRLDYEIQARKTSPGYGRGYMGHGPMRGYGYGRGYCMW